jgi:hypothetical protein
MRPAAGRPGEEGEGCSKSHTEAREFEQHEVSAGRHIFRVIKTLFGSRM